MSGRVGLVMDLRHGRLVFTNEESVTVDRVVYSWQRIESVRLDGSGRRAIVSTDLHRPRGLAIHSSQQSAAYSTVSLVTSLCLVGVCVAAAPLMFVQYTHRLTCNHAHSRVSAISEPPGEDNVCQRLSLRTPVA